MAEPLGERVRTLREARGWGADELARRAGLDPSAVTALERGETLPQATRIATSLAEAFDLSLEELIGGEP